MSYFSYPEKMWNFSQPRYCAELYMCNCIVLAYAMLFSLFIYFFK